MIVKTFFQNPSNIYLYLWFFVLTPFEKIAFGIFGLNEDGNMYAFGLWFFLAGFSWVWILIWIIVGIKYKQFNLYFTKAMLFMVLAFLVGFGSCLINLSLLSF